MQNRTDLALESYQSAEKTEIDGVIVKQKNDITIVDVVNENGAKVLGKPIGRYITLFVKSFVDDTDIFDGRLDVFSNVLKNVLPKNLNSILVVGLGNDEITADALGPQASNYVLATRHIIDELKNSANFQNMFNVSTISSGVLGKTGIETYEIIKGIVNQIQPSCVITVDALAASSADRLGNTIQFSNAGITPGSGVGNHRKEISSKTLGIPVIAIGIPTVVCTGLLSGKSEDDAFVTPKDIDRITQQGAKLIGMGINVCMQKDMSVKDLLALVG